MMEKKNLPDILLERYLCDEVSENEKLRIETECRDNDALRIRLEKMRQSNNKIMQTHAPDTVVNEIALKIHRENVRESILRDKSTGNGKKRLVPIPVWSYGLLALLLVIIPFTVMKQYGGSRQLRERTKGIKPSLTVYRDGGKDYIQLSDSTPVGAGDRLQIGYNAAGVRFGMILSVDGNGVLTLHYPEDTTTINSGSLLEQGGEQLLNASFELDEAPQFERFYFIASDDTLEVSEVVAECEKWFGNDSGLAGTAIETLPDNVMQSTITLIKE